MTSTHTLVQIFVRCSNLKDTDAFSKSDPYVCLFDITDGKKRLLGKTEVMKNNLNPQFKTVISTPFFFETVQNMRVEVWDKDSGSKDDDLGAADFTMGHLMSGRDSSITLPLKKKGTVTLTAVAESGKNGFVTASFRGAGLKKMDLFGKSDPYFYLRRVLRSGQKIEVYKSEVIDKTLNPQWKPTKSLNLQVLCGGDLVSPCIEFECWDRDRGSKDDPMGSFLMSGEQLLSGTGEHELVMTDKKGKTKSYGFICIDRCDFTPIPSFTDFLRGGLQLNIAFSIDFTGSNGSPSDPRSLHFYSPTQPNNYVRAMLAVSNVVQEYDSDRQFPAFGFGAIAPFTQGTSHFFPLNGNPQNAYCNGMQQVVDTYAALLPTLRFSGPTNFAPTILTMTQGAREARGVYTILLILTDGAITDMQDTIDAIVAADDAPLSVIIIGIGNADFSSMECLDCDNGVLRDSRGRVARRDLVQFVPFNRFEGKDPAFLAAAVLMEVPRQVEMWGMVAGAKPLS